MAHDFVKAGTSKRVLVVGVEKLTDFVDPTDRATAFIFADGAGAVIIGESDEVGIGPVVWGADADSRDAIVMNPPWTDMRSSSQKSSQTLPGQISLNKVRPFSVGRFSL